MTKKYEFTGETKTVGMLTLRQIRLLIDIPGVGIAGDIGGWIESEKNLSQSGNCWVSGDARVSDSASVSGDAWVSDSAVVFGAASVSDSAVVFGDAWVSGDARVSGAAWVSGAARVSDSASVSGAAVVFGAARVSGAASVAKTTDYLCVGPIGSRQACTTFYRTNDGIGVTCGCFTGTIEQFAKAVESEHGDNKHGMDYRAMIEFAKVKMEVAP